ncbi:MAG: sugar phosphate nucleotidyltransferase [candidate division WOR-3 bacterium]
MTVIIPVAGRGIRLRPISFNTPKALIPCGGRTVLGWIFKSISELSPDRIILVVGYKDELIKEWVKNNYKKLPIEWVTQEEPKGLAHAIWKVGKLIPFEEDVLIYLGDSIFDFDWKGIKKEEENFVGVKEVEDPRRFGIVEVEGDFIVNLEEKPETPSSSLAVAGIYYIKKWELLYKYLNIVIEKSMKTKGEYQLTDALKLMITKGKIKIKKFPVKKWYDCGSIPGLLQTNMEILKDYPSWFENEERIENFSYISPSSLVKDSIIGPFVTLGENSVIERSTVKNSIIGNRVRISNSDIFDSIIGDDTVIVNIKGKIISSSNSIIAGKE